MSDTAVWQTEHVLPTVPIRQWVCSLPWGLRAIVGYDRELCALVVETFVRIRGFGLTQVRFIAHESVLS